MDPEAGMLRIVMGLGTKAVDRTKEDYPRLSNLDRPAATIYATVEQKHKFSQRNIDVLDCQTNAQIEVPMAELLPILPLWYKRMVMEHDMEAERNLRQRGVYRDVWFVSCQKLLEKPEFTGLMQKILKTLERVYGNPVDIEYTVNMDETGDFVINLLQCRPLYLGQKGEKVDLEQQEMKETFFDIVDSSMGASGKRKVDVVVQIDPVLYYEYPYGKKYDVASAVGVINRYYRGSGKNLLLMTPGRIGTSSPELGVPVTFGDISNFSIVCEVSDNRAGYMPELSYGSHMFQDLVEAEIIYGAIWNDKKTLQYHPELPEQYPNRFQEICPDFSELSGMIQVREPEDWYFLLDAVTNHSICGR